MKNLVLKITFGIVILMSVSSAASIAQPAGPGDGTDPFATPVNGGVAFVAAIGFLFGVYRIYQLNKKRGTKNID